MRIAESAGKDDIAHEDAWHALRNAIRQLVKDDVTMLICPARDGALLETGVLDIGGEDSVVIHAMALGPKFYPYL